MAAQFPNGSIFSIGTVLGSPITVTGVSNANPGVVSAASHGLANGDIVVVTSGWPRLNDAIARVADQASGTFELEGYDTTNTTVYPTGAGGGSVRKVTTWVAMSQITDTATSGGETQFYQWKYLEDGQARQRPIGRSARAMEITMDFDPDLSWHAALLAASDAGTPHPFRVALPNGDFIYYNFFVSFDGEPNFVVDTNMAVTCALSFANPRSQRYAA